MDKISTWHIHITGQVQGVGFRPFVYQLAKRYRLKGWVGNSTDGVHIEFNAVEAFAKKFFNEVAEKSPALAKVTSQNMKEASFAVFDDFGIAPGSYVADPVLLLSPDFALCDSCRTEVTEPSNRRYQYAFTTCTQCGPRYSILKSLPYDRENTSMDTFPMCTVCKQEYNDASNRRHFSQTNSCPDCAIEMKLYDNRLVMIEEDQEKIIKTVCKLWNEGHIVAIKGIGGYLLTCDATNSTAIKELRRRKHRPAKPFALMFSGMAHLQKEACINEQEEKELKSSAAPIVLLQLKETLKSQLPFHEIAPRLTRIGAMLPYSPLYQLLLQQFSKAIVATSGNISGGPIVFEDAAALNELNTIADYVLVHNRLIISPQDDSVVTFSRYSHQRVVLRRARGMAPLYLNRHLALPEHSIVAMGALLKSSFTLLHQRNIHASQYLGNTDYYDAQINYQKQLHQFLHLFKAVPEMVLIDKHPEYFTSQLGKQLAADWKSELVAVQHHEAHFASVLGEQNLLQETEPILGVIWDGTGLGNDGNIWGGEFFKYQHGNFSRAAHFQYFHHFLGDKMAIEPRLSAFALCYEMEEAQLLLKRKFSDEEWNNYQHLIKKSQLRTSSVGRMFDAVASLLGLTDKVNFEGEAAMLLQEEAQKFFSNKLLIPNEWIENSEVNNSLSTTLLINGIVHRVKQEMENSETAAWFHVQLIMAVKKVASFHQCRKIGFSGGVFQNSLLVDLAIEILSKDFQLYFNKDLPANDENSSFGQLMWWTITKQFTN